MNVKKVVLSITLCLSLSCLGYLAAGKKASFSELGAYHGQWYTEDDLLCLSDGDDESGEKISFLEFLKLVFCCKAMPNLKQLPRKVLKKLLHVYNEYDDLENLQEKKES